MGCFDAVGLHPRDVSADFVLVKIQRFERRHCGKGMERQVDSLMWAKLGLMVLLALFAILVIVPITFARWWLRTDAGARLGKAWSWAVENAPFTVLFADLKGSMELLADRDPKEARKLLDPVLEHMMEAVHRFEGTVNQVMGDGIMALFGAPLAHETMPCARPTPRCACRTRSRATPRAYAARKASRSTSASG
jgi:hypothetical protein